MLRLFISSTDEKNISLAVKGYKIFFSSTSLSLKSKPIAGLKIKCKPVVGFNQKNCQLFSGRGTLLFFFSRHTIRQGRQLRTESYLPITWGWLLRRLTE